VLRLNTACYDALGMRKSARLLSIALTLVLWVVSGPVGMAFDGCAMMGAMCEAPCGALSYIAAPRATGLAILQPLAYLEPSASSPPAIINTGPLTPPPKSALLSA